MLLSSGYDLYRMEKPPDTSNSPQNVSGPKAVSSAKANGVFGLKRDSVARVQAPEVRQKINKRTTSLLELITTHCLDYALAQPSSLSNYHNDSLSQQTGQSELVLPPRNIITPFAIGRKPSAPPKRLLKPSQNVHLKVLSLIKKESIKQSCIKRGIEKDICCICESGLFAANNMIYFCTGPCGCGFHQKCYHMDAATNINWRCREPDCISLRDAEGTVKWREKSKRFMLGRRKGAFSETLSLSHSEKETLKFWNDMERFFNPFQLYCALDLLRPSAYTASEYKTPALGLSYERKWIEQESHLIGQTIDFEFDSESPSDRSKPKRFSLLYRFPAQKSSKTPISSGTLFRMINTQYALALHLVTSEKAHCQLEGSPFAYTFPPQPYDAVFGRFTDTTAFTGRIPSPEAIGLSVEEPIGVSEDQDEVCSELWVMRQELQAQVRANTIRKQRLLDRIISKGSHSLGNVRREQTEFWSTLDAFSLYMSRKLIFQNPSLHFLRYRMNHPLMNNQSLPSRTVETLSALHSKVHRLAQSMEIPPISSMGFAMGSASLNNESQSVVLCNQGRSYLRRRKRLDYMFHVDRNEKSVRKALRLQEEQSQKRIAVIPSSPTKKNLKMSIVCHCDGYQVSLDDMGRSVLCGKCAKWFHYKCHHISIQVLVSISEYMCVNCVEGGRVSTIGDFIVDPVVDRSDVYDYASNRVFLRPKRLHVLYGKKRVFVNVIGFRIQNVEGMIFSNPFREFQLPESV